ncbi:MAG: DUF2141 domain-containing protein [Flavobacterium macrobrachii]
MINDFENTNYNLIITLHNNSSSFFNDKVVPFKTFIEKIDDTFIIKSFTNIPECDYALIVFHDENNNKKIDVNIFGMSKEGYGVSYNNVKKRKNIKFEDSKFTLDNTKGISIKLKY